MLHTPPQLVLKNTLKPQPSQPETDEDSGSSKVSLSEFTSAASITQEPLKIKNAVPVGFWFFHGFDDKCPICYQPLMSLCTECEGYGNNCSVYIGECHHKLHRHCRSKYNNSDKCVMCFQPWKTAKEVLL